MSLSHHSNKEDSKGENNGDKHAGFFWLAVCSAGMITTLTLYGIVLEFVTSGGRKLHEFSFVFVTTAIYALTAYVARGLFGEKPTQISKYHMLTLSLTSIASTFTSVRSLRYVIYPVQVLFKSCKPVPVMLFGVMLGTKYPLRKYVNVMVITAGVALFMGGGKSSSKAGSGSESTFTGAILLSISLCFDGATGAYEEKLMSHDHVEPFDLMYNIQLGKAVISFCTLVATNGLSDFVQTINHGGINLLLLGLTGAIGQVFVFVTISKFGALNCALIGLARKMLSLLLSFILYGHILNVFQTVGLGLSVVAMVANFYEKGGKKHGEVKHSIRLDKEETVKQEESSLLAVDITDEEEIGPDEGVNDDINLYLASKNNEQNAVLLDQIQKQQRQQQAGLEAIDSHYSQLMDLEYEASKNDRSSPENFTSLPNNSENSQNSYTSLPDP